MRSAFGLDAAKIEACGIVHGCGFVWGLPMVGTESRNRNLTQKSHGSLKDILEKLFGRGGELSKGAMVALGHAFREDEMIFALHIDMLETQWS